MSTNAGKDGTWPHHHALRTYLRRTYLPTGEATTAQVARHETGHLVVRHALGDRAIRATARPTDRFRGEVFRVEGAPWSHENELIGSLGGRIEDERQGRIDGLNFTQGSDEGDALRNAIFLAEGDPTMTAALVGWGYAQAKEILDARQPAVEELTALMTERDIYEDDILRVLGSLPEPTYELKNKAGVPLEFSEGAMWFGIASMLQGRPYAWGVLEGDTYFIDARARLIRHSPNGCTDVLVSTKPEHNAA